MSIKGGKKKNCMGGASLMPRKKWLYFDWL